jgi:DNA invertase Pin-like site-specific DNA recombinase
MVRKVRVPQRSAVYARISQDRDGESAGVERQVKECQELADSLGWSVLGVYIDDDVSAFSGRRRPEYERLTRDIAERHVDGLLVWHNDRLHRRTRDLEPFINLVELLDFPIHSVRGGAYDLSTSDGRFMARMMGTVATHESEHKGERVMAASRQRAESGRPNGGSRPFGYESDGMTVRESEAQVIRLATQRFIAGESLKSICEYLNDHDMPTATGKQWSVTGLSQMLQRARNSGQRERHGQIIGLADWPAIVTAEQTAAIIGILADPARKLARAPRRYLLAGLLRCHACGGTLVAHPTGQRRTYVCKKVPGRPNCGGLSIGAEAIEAITTEAVLMRLDTPLVDSTPAPDLSGPAVDDPATLQTRKDTLTDMLAQGEMTRDAYVRAVRQIDDKLRALDRLAAMTFRRTEIDAYKSHPGRLRREWPNLPLSRQQAVLKAVLDHVVIGPGVRGKGSIPEDRFHPVWRV